MLSDGSELELAAETVNNLLAGRSANAMQIELDGGVAGFGMVDLIVRIDGGNGAGLASTVVECIEDNDDGLWGGPVCP